MSSTLFEDAIYCLLAENTIVPNVEQDVVLHLGMVSYKYITLPGSIPKTLLTWCHSIRAADATERF